MTYDLNPVSDAVNFFIAIWENLPAPVHSLFYISLLLTVIWAFYKLLSR